MDRHELQVHRTAGFRSYKSSLFFPLCATLWVGFVQALFCPIDFLLKRILFFTPLKKQREFKVLDRQRTWEQRPASPVFEKSVTPSRWSQTAIGRQCQLITQWTEQMMVSYYGWYRLTSLYSLIKWRLVWLFLWDVFPFLGTGNCVWWGEKTTVGGRKVRGRQKERWWTEGSLATRPSVTVTSLHFTGPALIG